MTRPLENFRGHGTMEFCVLLVYELWVTNIWSAVSKFHCGMTNEWPANEDESYYSILLFPCPRNFGLQIALLLTIFMDMIENKYEGAKVRPQNASQKKVKSDEFLG